MIKKTTLIIIIMSSILFTGCWNYSEIDNLYIVSGFAIDKGVEKNYLITAELINIRTSQVNQEFESLLIELEGDTIFETIRSMIRISSRKLFWSHASSVIVSHQVAEEGIAPVIDWLSRDQEPRLNMDLYISKEKTAAETLKSMSYSTDITSFELESMSNRNKDVVKTPILKIYEIVNELAHPKTSLLLPTVLLYNNIGDKTVLLAGGSVFKGDKLIGYVEQNDVVYYLLIRNKFDEGFLKIDMDKRENEAVVLEIQKSKTKISPNYGEEIGFTIDVDLNVGIIEMTTDKDYINEPGRSHFIQAAQKQIEQNVKDVIGKVQEDFGVDIFGFGAIIKQRNPHLWKEIEQDWDMIFKDLDVEVNCSIKIKNSGHFKSPIKVSD